MQEVDAERRLAILRGEEPPPLPPPTEDESARLSIQGGEGAPGRERRKRKRNGEDDTDFELRIAMERSSQVQVSRQDAAQRKTSNAPIVGRDGHIDLFGAADKATHSGKNEDAEAEKRKAKKELEEQYAFRLSDAAGKGSERTPWYSKDTSSSTELVTAESVGKDAFGREDPGRKKRDADRINANDPLAMMKRGAAKVREVKKERQKIQEERDSELRQMQREERRQERREREERRARHAEHRSRRHRDNHHDRSSSRRHGHEKRTKSAPLEVEDLGRSPRSSRRSDVGGRSGSRSSR